MNKILLTLSVSDLIQIISIITSTVLALVSLWIAIKSMKQSQKSIQLTETSIEEANRPYIVVYHDYIQVLSSIHEYLVVKNFGNTGAIVDSLYINPPYQKDALNGSSSGFTQLTNTFIAPNQSLNTTIFADAFKNKRIGLTEISITYHNGSKQYSDTFTFNEGLVNDIQLTKSIPSKSKSVEEVISRATEELLRRNL